jgi:hypothetical protein
MRSNAISCSAHGDSSGDAMDAERCIHLPRWPGLGDDINFD